MLKSVFSTGANISKEKDKNENAVMSGLIIGSIVGLIVFGFIVINIDSYINFINMDINTYRLFGIYYVIQLYIQLVFTFILNKLYYEEKISLANKYSLIFNILNFIKYDSVELFNNIAFFLIFLFGLSNALEYGENYALALTFVSLITYTQWDVYDSITTVAKIDISKAKFNYLEHVKNAYKLLAIILISVFIMFITLYNFYNFYNLNIIITLIFISFELINFAIYPIYKIKACYLQLEYSAKKTTCNKVFSSFLRMVVSLLKTPYCTGLGQITSSIYQFITINIMFKKIIK